MFQVSAGGVVFQGGNILVLKKHNGLYCIPKGRIEKGETLEQTALREVREETGITGEILTYIGKVSYAYRNDRPNILVEKEVHWYVMRAISGKLRPQRKEGFVEARFVRPEEILRMLRYKDERAIVYDAMKMWKELA